MIDSEITCEWCGSPATGRRHVNGSREGSAGCYAYHCNACEGKCVRFFAALAGIEGPLVGTDWLPNGRPDLVIQREGQSPLTVKDARQLNKKAIRELLPPAPKARKRHADLTPAELVDDIAKRREKVRREAERLDREVRELVASRALPASRIAKALGVSRQRVYQLAG